MSKQHIYIPANIDPAAINALDRADGLSYDAPGKVSREDALTGIASATGLIIRSGITIDREMFEAAPKLKAIARAGVGVDNIDLDEATKRGVIVMNTPDGNTVATAELAFGLMLCLARQITSAHNSLAAGRWDRSKYKGMELRGKTLGIVGFGRVGQAIGKRADIFGMELVTYDPYIPARVAAQNNAEMLPLDELYARSDFITLHALVTDETRGMINAESIAKMKPGIRIINAARGALIDADALAEGIKSGQVAGAGLDVFDPEPPTDNPLIGLEGVVHTPHLGASTADAQVAVAVDAAYQLIDGLLGGEWKNVVNRDVLK